MDDPRQDERQSIEGESGREALERIARAIEGRTISSVDHGGDELHAGNYLVLELSGGVRLYADAPTLYGDPDAPRALEIGTVSVARRAENVGGEPELYVFRHAADAERFADALCSDYPGVLEEPVHESLEGYLEQIEKAEALED